MTTERPSEFAVGDEVVFKEDGAHAIVRWSKEGYSAVKWVDEDAEEFGGSVVANDRLGLVRSANR
jgi:uncharacterized protein YodC (DUF2158 family)